MTDLGKSIQDDKGVTRPDEEGREGSRNARTAGTDRDLDESGEAKNQGHGHGRERTEGADQAGHSESTQTEADRQERDLGGPGG